MYFSLFLKLNRKLDSFFPRVYIYITMVPKQTTLRPEIKKHSKKVICPSFSMRIRIIVHTDPDILNVLNSSICLPM